MARPPRSSPDQEFVELCGVDEIQDGRAKGIRLTKERRDSVFIVRRGQEVVVFENRCPHLGASLPWQRNEYLNAHGTRIVCSAHGAQFDIRSGQCTDGPAIGHALRRIATTIDERGVIIARRSDLPSYLALASID